MLCLQMWESETSVNKWLLWSPWGKEGWLPPKTLGIVFQKIKNTVPTNALQSQQGIYQINFEKKAFLVILENGYNAATHFLQPVTRFGKLLRKLMQFAISRKFVFFKRALHKDCHMSLKEAIFLRSRIIKSPEITCYTPIWFNLICFWEIKGTHLKRRGIEWNTLQGKT